jgi:hypothetical protein
MYCPVPHRITAHCIAAAGRAECERLQSSAVNACINTVRNKGAAIFPDLEQECADLGMETGVPKRWDWLIAHMWSGGAARQPSSWT